MRALPVDLPQALAGPATARVRHERDVVGEVGGDDSRGVGSDVVRRQPFQLGRRDLDATDVVADVALELLADPDQLFIQGASAGARLWVLVHAGAPEVAERAEQVPARRIVLA